MTVERLTINTTMTVSKQKGIVALALLFYCLQAVQAAQFCPDVDAPCMNEENWRHCKAIEESGCQILQMMKSCPVQFRCGDHVHGAVPSPAKKKKKRGKKSRKGSGKKGGRKNDNDDDRKDDKEEECSYSEEKCAFQVASACAGECPMGRRSLQGGKGGVRDVFQELSLTYKVPQSKCKPTSFCLVAEPDSLCQMMSATATVTVDGKDVVTKVPFSLAEDSFEFEVPKDAGTIAAAVSIQLNPAIRCIREGSFNYFLATNVEH